MRRRTGPARSAIRLRRYDSVGPKRRAPAGWFANSGSAKAATVVRVDTEGWFWIRNRWRAAGRRPL